MHSIKLDADAQPVANKITLSHPPSRWTMAPREDRFAPFGLHSAKRLRCRASG
jgi:hypothetical protein